VGGRFVLLKQLLYGSKDGIPKPQYYRIVLCQGRKFHSIAGYYTLDKA